MAVDDTDPMKRESAPISRRFRGYLPVVVDLETGGFNAATDAVLEVGMVPLDIDEQGQLKPQQGLGWAVLPFAGANIEEASLDFVGIEDPYSEKRQAADERLVFGDMLRRVRKLTAEKNCKRAVLVGHNAHFDHAFLMAAATRCSLKRNPFHPFSVFDTVVMAGVAFGQTVLSRACLEANIPFDDNAAHSALYDAEKTAALFCAIVNRWHEKIGIPQSLETAVSNDISR